MMKKLSRLIPLAAFAPFFALAADPGNFEGFQVFIVNLSGFINNILVPFVFALALLLFLWGMFTTFILGGQDEEKREKGKKLMLWAIIAFVVMVSIWGIVNFVADAFGFTDPELIGIPVIPTR